MTNTTFLPFKRIVVLLILLNLLTSYVYAQNPHQNAQRPGGGEPIGVITGTVVDKIDETPLEYTSIVLYRLRDSSMINGVITDVKGNFKFEKVPFGRYYLMVSFIGYNNLKVPNISIKPPTTEVNLGKILLGSSASNLSEVNIVGEKKLMEFKLDKKVVNVERMITTAGGTAIDVLQNVPSVTVDYDGAVSVRGNSNITILIDGRPSSVTGAKLESIPASSIESVELITNPSAKYNPEGMSGIINIKLKKKKTFGLNSLISLNAGTGDKYNGSINLNYSLKKINLFASFDSRYNRRKGWGEMYRTSTLKDTTLYLNANSESFRSGNSNNLKIGADFYLNSKNILTLTWLYNQGISKDSQESNSSNYDNNYNIFEQYTSKEYEDEKDFANDFALNYKKTFDKKGKEFTTDISYSSGISHEGSNLANYYYLLNYNPIANVIPEKQKQNTDGKNFNANIQSNFILPFEKDAKLEAGFQGIYRSNDDNFAIDKYNNLITDWYPDTAQSNHFIYNEQIYAIYGIFSKEYKKWSFQIGTRLEQAFTKAEQRTIIETNNRQYFSIFPTLHTTYKLKENQDFQLSYSRRINRPDMHSLNPFVEKSNPNFIRYGNPNLKPEYINSLELGHSIFWKKTSINSSLFYRQINDVIKRYSFLDTNRVSHMTASNFATGKSYGLEMMLEQTIFKWWRVNANFSYFRTIIEGDKQNTSLTNDNYSWTSKLNSSMMLPKGFMIQLSGFYRGPMVTPQGQMDAMYSSDFAIKKDFFKDKLSTSIRLSDIFNTQQFTMKASDVNFSSEHTRKRESRVLFFGLSYKINDYKRSKTQKRNIENTNEPIDEM